MRKRNKFLLAFLLVIGLTGLASCGGGGTPATPTKTADPTTTTTPTTTQTTEVKTITEAKFNEVVKNYGFLGQNANITYDLTFSNGAMQLTGYMKAAGNKFEFDYGYGASYLQIRTEENGIVQDQYNKRSGETTYTKSTREFKGYFADFGEFGLVFDRLTLNDFNFDAETNTYALKEAKTLTYEDFGTITFSALKFQFVNNVLMNIDVTYTIGSNNVHATFAGKNVGTTTITLPTVEPGTTPTGPTPTTTEPGTEPGTAPTGSEPQHVHTLEHVAKKDSTCTEDGNEEYWHCTTCGKYYLEQEAINELEAEEVVIRAEGHSTDYVSEEPATCTENGLGEHYYCSDCGKYFLDSYGETEVSLADLTIAAYGHDYRCEAENVELSQDKTTATLTIVCYTNWDHTLTVEGTVGKEILTQPDCETDGLVKYTITFTKEAINEAVGKTLVEENYVIEKREKIPATGHTFSDEWTQGDYSHWHEATCGHTTFADQAPHEFGEWKINKAATASENGEKERTCSVCGYVEKETLYAYLKFELLNDETYKVYLAYNENARKYYIETTEGPKNVVIPETYNDKPVTMIGSFDSAYIESLTIPASIKSFTEYAVFNTALKKIYWNTDQVVSVNNDLFKNLALDEIIIGKDGKFYNDNGRFTANTKKFSVAEDATYHSAHDDMLFNADGTKIMAYPLLKEAPETLDLTVYTGLTTITQAAFYTVQIQHVILPESLTTIGPTAFQRGGLVEVTIPENLEEIGGRAFDNSTELTRVLWLAKDCKQASSQAPFSDTPKLTEIIVGDKDHVVESLPDGVFRYANSVETFTLNEGLKTIGEAVFTSNALKELVVPDSVETVKENAFYLYHLEKLTAPAAILAYMPKTPKEVIVTNGEELPKDAFANNANLVKVTLPNTITKIGKAAFANCTALKSISLPSDVDYIDEDAFYGCTGLETFIIPEKVTWLKRYVFAGSGLKSVVIPETVTLMEDYAFDNCKIEEITASYDHLKKAIGYGHSYKGLLKKINILGNKIGSFSDYTGLESIVFNDDVYIIESSLSGNDPFAKNTKLVFKEEDGAKYLGSKDNPYFYLAHVDDKTITTFNCKADTKIIGPEAFKEFTNLATITLPSGLKTIGREAFYGCTALTSVSYPDSLLRLDIDAFYGCTALEEITFTKNSKLEYAGSAFNGCSALRVARIPGAYLTNEATLPLGALEELEVVNGTSIPYEAFKYAKNLTTVTLPDTLETISIYAFRGCDKLTTVVMPSVKEICQRAFCNCPLLESITIPGNVEHIEMEAFKDCAALVTVVFEEGQAETVLDGRAFYNCGVTSLTLSKNIVKFDGVPFECGDLTEATYTGTKAEFNSIDKPSYWRYSTLKTIHCTDGDITF